MSSETDDRPPVERLIEAAIFGPLDLTARVVQELPFAVNRTRQQLVFARFIGKMAVDQGVAELRRRVEGSTEPEADDPAPSEPAVSEPVTTNDAAEASTDAPAADGVDDPVAPRPQRDGELALPDYEQLPSAHVVAKLAGLSQAERDAIEVYERAHRNRRTVLGKLDQLRATDDLVPDVPAPDGGPAR